MESNHIHNSNIEIPEGFIVFISGVPGAGKTTISYELLKRFNEFRIIEETDLVREVLRGYNEFIKKEFGHKSDFIFEKLQIADHMNFLSFDEAKQQCTIMKMSFKNIIERQQRKGISSIINGVHIVPEILDGLANNHNLIFINLYLNNEDVVYKRFKNRDQNKYSLKNIPHIYQSNVDLYLSTQRLASKTRYTFNNIDVTNLNINETLIEVVKCINQRIENS